jgi:hypothetical protein
MVNINIGTDEDHQTYSTPGKMKISMMFALKSEYNNYYEQVPVTQWQLCLGGSLKQ